MSFQYDSERAEPREPEKLTVDERYDLLKSMSISDLLEYLPEKNFKEVKEYIVDTIIGYNLDTENL